MTAEVASGKIHYYPEKALSAGVTSGEAVLDCLVDGEWLTDCKVASEEPSGYDFGAAALRMAPLFKMKPQPDPTKQPAAGARIQVPINFNLPT
ncbi:TonB family protein [Phenylobacterium sp.]|uniref:TonB family protein n=1 Tax=Phenylobacterium sp. TaxID=1871053 RepID=UPI002E2FFE27|nr:TonB family protein [Phenylobacterium sp.]HEX3365655.1 TonB family protein [Phenylobacterium sp.]